MTVEDVFKLMQNPGNMNRETAIKLKELVEEYPYFQTAQLLYLKNLQKIKDFSFPPELRKSAVCIPDRKVLYCYIEKEKFESFDFDAYNHNNSSQLTTSFSMIEFFLSAEVEPEKKEEKGKKKEALVSTDYISILQNESEGENKDILPMKHQETIDSFLEKDKQSPVKIKLPEEQHPASGIPTIWEKKDFFGETLAKVYIKQKKYEKALLIIQNLSLQNPEKSAYFAIQIEELKKLIINKN